MIPQSVPKYVHFNPYNHVDCIYICSSIFDIRFDFNPCNHVDCIPEGYRIPVNPDGSDIVYTIKAESIPVDNIFKVIINGKEYDSNSNGDFKVTGTKADRVVDMTITNHTTKKLPETGSYWMIPILILGVCMMVCGRKKPQNPHRE